MSLLGFIVWFEIMEFKYSIIFLMRWPWNAGSADENIIKGCREQLLHFLKTVLLDFGVSKVQKNWTGIFLECKLWNAILEKQSAVPQVPGTGLGVPSTYKHQGSSKWLFIPKLLCFEVHNILRSKAQVTEIYVLSYKEGAEHQDTFQCV